MGDKVESPWGRHIKQALTGNGSAFFSSCDILLSLVARHLKTEWMPKEFYCLYDEAETDVEKYVILYCNIASCHSHIWPNATEKLTCSP